MSLARTFTLAALALSACAPRYIRGTEIPDTPDTKAIVDVLTKYKAAMEAKDPNALLALVSESYRDDAGTPSPSDDLDYARLREVLPKRFAQVDDLRMELDLRAINVDRNDANAVFRYSTQYRLPAFKQKPQHDSDLAQMWFRKVGGQWKIVSGL